MSCRITHPCILLLSYTYTHDSIKTFSERKLNSWSKYKSLGWLHKTIEEKHKRAQSSNVLQQIQPINPLKFDNNSQFHSPSFFFFFLLLFFFPANIEPSNQSSDVPVFTCKFPIQILFTHLYRRSQTSIDRSWPSTCVHETICTRLSRPRHQADTAPTAPISRSYRGFPPLLLFRSFANPTPRNPSRDRCTEIRRRCIDRSCKSSVPPPPLYEEIQCTTTLLCNTTRNTVFMENTTGKYSVLIDDFRYQEFFLES